MHQRPADKGIDNAGAIVVAPREQTGPCQRADGTDVKARQIDALRREAIEIWRLDDLVAMTAEVAVALIVGNDDDHIGPPHRLGSTDLTNDKEAEDERATRRRSHAMVLASNDEDHRKEPES